VLVLCHVKVRKVRRKLNVPPEVVLKWCIFLICDDRCFCVCSDVTVSNNAVLCAEINEEWLAQVVQPFIFCLWMGTDWVDFRH
jgi:hypothetical protein